ncbi:hypothetical protein NPIL_453471 [Nephila pilipes]|uniref:Uncharacterized protein n=1 Tax=Nephila pilipes TaxID=299642 RepID=A0A8X6K5A1_NEPPI|nr:hypothetical protein NPIL_453471 [Nephila pilipes]
MSQSLFILSFTKYINSLNFSRNLLKTHWNDVKETPNDLTDFTLYLLIHYWKKYQKANDRFLPYTDNPSVLTN